MKFLFLLVLCCLSSAQVTWTLGSGNTVGFTSFWAGNFTRQTFPSNPPALANCTDGVSCPASTYSSLGNVSAGFTATSAAAGANSNSFFVFPFSNSASCGAIGCPNLNPLNVSSSNGGRAVYLEAGESVQFNFVSPIGAFALNYAVSSSQVGLAVDFLPTPVSAPSASALVTPATGGPLSTLFLEPTVTPLHAATFSSVKITANVSTWFVFNDLTFGQTGYQCIGQPTYTYALSINLLGLPNATWISYDGDGSGRNSPVPNGGTIYTVGQIGGGVGNQIVIICVPSGNPFVSVYDQTLAFHSWVDGGNITCSSGHLTTPTCYLDPRAVYTVPLPCIPSLPNNTDYSLDISLWWDGNGPALVIFREFALNYSTITINPKVWVLATKSIFSSLSLVNAFGQHLVDTLRSSPSDCRKSNSIPYPATCVSSSINGPVSNVMNFRTKCYTDPNILPMPTNVTVNVTFNTDPENPNTNVQLTWLLPDVGNQDFSLCVPAFGDFHYNAVEYGINPVTTDDASVNCSPNLATSRCQTTPLDLVSILQGPQVCRDVPRCNGTNWSRQWVGGNVSGFPYSLSYGDTLFRELELSPYEQLRQCVLNLNEVRVSAVVETSQAPLNATLVAAFDCTWPHGETPGLCSPYPDNPTNFFSILRVDALGLPAGVNYRVNLVSTSIEYGQVVCSTGTLSGTFCSAGDTLQYICVPAIGSDLQPLNCSDDYRPLRLEIEAEECGHSTVEFVSSVPATGNQNFGGTLVEEFVVGTSDLLVTSLCAYDSGANGLTGPIAVGISTCDSTGLLANIVSTTITNGNSVPSSGGSFRCATIAATVLTSGQTYCVASYGFTADLNYNSNIAPFTNVAFQSAGLTVTRSAYSNSASLSSNAYTGSQTLPGGYTFGAGSFLFEIPCFASSAGLCRPYNERCIHLNYPLDCRQGFNVTGSNCSANIGMDLCVWDLLALPAGSQTIELLPASTLYNNAVRTIGGQGGRPATFRVLGTDLRVRITESPTSTVTSDVIHCQYTKAQCNYNDFLSILNIDQALAYNGELVLQGVNVAIQNLPNRPPYPAGRGCPRCNTKVAVLADPNHTYTLQYTWLGAYTRTISGVQCSACPLQGCSALPCIVRWFAVDPTCPSQVESDLVRDGIGLNVTDSNDERFKSYGNPWVTGLIPTINDHTLVSKTYSGTICNPVPGQQPYQIYYVLANDNSATTDYSVTMNLGCDAETYRLHCGFNVEDTPKVSCGVACTIATTDMYSKACSWVPTGSNILNVGPNQTTNCAGVTSCSDGWQALTPMMNINVDLRCLPDGSSDLSSTLPAFSTNQNNYRGDNYTNFQGQLTQRRNPIDISICCGCRVDGTVGYDKDCDGCGQCTTRTYSCGALPPVGISCDNPVVLREAGGYQNIFCGLYHQVPSGGLRASASRLVIEVQELFRSEAATEWEEARPTEFPDRCPNIDVNYVWQQRIQSKRPTVCTQQSWYNACGPSQQGHLCSATYRQGSISNWVNKLAAYNEVALKFTYSLAFQQFPNILYNPVQPISWNVTRSHTLLRPNKLAAPADVFCAIRDNFYQLQVNDQLLHVGSQPVYCAFPPVPPGFNCSVLVPPSQNVNLQFL